MFINTENILKIKICSYVTHNVCYNMIKFREKKYTLETFSIPIKLVCDLSYCLCIHKYFQKNLTIKKLKSYFIFILNITRSDCNLVKIHFNLIIVK